MACRASAAPDADDLANAASAASVAEDVEVFLILEHCIYLSRPGPNAGLREGYKTVFSGRQQHCQC